VVCTSGRDDGVARHEEQTNQQQRSFHPRLLALHLFLIGNRIVERLCVEIPPGEGESVSLRARPTKKDTNRHEASRVAAAMGSGITDEDQNETVYPHVRFRKVAGSLLLSSSKLIFRAAAGSETPFDWQRVAKHQVSPASYAKSLLKMVLADGSNATFQLPDRPTLERIRNDITKRLQDLRTSPPVAAASSDPSLSGHKRSLTEMSKGSRTSKKASFGELDATSLAVARSTVLSAHPSLRQQHQFLVEKSKTVSEEDFWKTHEGLLGEEYARMSGLAKAGSSSILQSHVPASGRVTLGVDEMKCIFILYPVSP
jgi:hypothetical protein